MIFFSNVCEPVSGRPTNNAGEIQGATRAIRDAGARGVDKLTIHTDSDFMRNSVTSWMPNWKNNNWNKSDGNPVVNQRDFQDLDRAMRNNPQMEVEFLATPAIHTTMLLIVWPSKAHSAMDATIKLLFDSCATISNAKAFFQFNEILKIQ